jgi:hypothetical protein
MPKLNEGGSKYPKDSKIIPNPKCFQESSWHSRLSIKNQLCPFTSPRPDVHYIAADLLILGGKSLQRRGGRAGGLCSGHSGRLHFEGAASSGHLVGEQCKDQRLVGLVLFSVLTHEMMIPIDFYVVQVSASTTNQKMSNTTWQVDHAVCGIFRPRCWPAALRSWKAHWHKCIWFPGELWPSFELDIAG